MKIAFYSGDMGQQHASRIIDILKNHAPNHSYNHCADCQQPDLWHCMKPYCSLASIRRASRSVVSLSDLRFITHPELFSLSDRIFRLPLYRYHCRHAALLIAQNSQAKSRVVDALGVDKDRVEVCMALRAVGRDSHEYHPSNEQMLAVRKKLNLAESYILVMGEADTMHDHGTILHAIFSMPQSIDVVICTRRTTYSDTLLKMVRDVGAADRVQFIYEVDSYDLASLYRMALVMIYMPLYESSVEPIVGALHQAVPMILSDTPLNREAAGRAAQYVASANQELLMAAIKMLIYNESFRGQMIAQCWAEARRYSDESVAGWLSQIYESV